MNNTFKKFMKFALADNQLIEAVNECKPKDAASIVYKLLDKFGDFNNGIYDTDENVERVMSFIINIWLNHDLNPLKYLQFTCGGFCAFIKQHVLTLPTNITYISTGSFGYGTENIDAGSIINDIPGKIDKLIIKGDGVNIGAGAFNQGHFNLIRIEGKNCKIWSEAFHFTVIDRFEYDKSTKFYYNWDCGMHTIKEMVEI